MEMSIKYRELIEKSQAYLKEMIPSATAVSFEEIGKSLAIENPPNAVVVVLSYTDSSAQTTIPTLFSKRMKAIYMNESGELLAVKNKLG